ncbi:MAG: hypothetical protein MRJ67_02180 [Nitrospirales bacterium]|nr:hypothetical protein [Nitrospira sp.]MDR4459319.1 hypothetical protein [Nitrospirales bacterium]MDR4483286.1 hypothetical protein [Nitrospirales bacterium]
MKKNKVSKMKLFREHIGQNVSLKITEVKENENLEKTIWEGSGKISKLDEDFLHLDVQVSYPFFWNNIYNIVPPWDGKNLVLPLSDVEGRLDSKGKLTLVIAQSTWNRSIEELKKMGKGKS